MSLLSITLLNVIQPYFTLSVSRNVINISRSSTGPNTLLCGTTDVVVLVVGPISHEGLLYSNPPMEFRHSSPEALHTKRRERPLLAKDGTNAKEFS
jgi:hypothetical protein